MYICGMTFTMMPTLSLLTAPQVVVMTTCGAVSDDKVGILAIVIFPCYKKVPLYFSALLHYMKHIFVFH